MKEIENKLQFFLSLTDSFKDHQPSCWQQFLFQCLSLAETSTRLLEMQSRASQLRGCLPREDGTISRETWQEHQVSIASSYQLQERDTEALEWAVRHACYGSGVPAMERDTRYRREMGCSVSYQNPGNPNSLSFFRLHLVDNLVAQRESSRGQIDIYDVLCD